MPFFSVVYFGRGSLRKTGQKGTTGGPSVPFWGLLARLRSFDARAAIRAPVVGPAQEDEDHHQRRHHQRAAADDHAEDLLSERKRACAVAGGGGRGWALG